MSAPATIPFSAPSTTCPASAPQANSQPWSPSDRDRLIFQWVKFEGHTQSWVADQLAMHQSSVSRIVERYERWIARGGPARQGGLSHDERLRSQQWLTYERNEWIVASALRLAGEMERAIETSRSNIKRHASDPTRELEVRTEYKMLDRSGIAARFLRLAHRVGMDQLQLVEQEPLAELEPLTIDDAELEQEVSAEPLSHRERVAAEPPGEGVQEDRVGGHSPPYAEDEASLSKDADAEAQWTQSEPEANHEEFENEFLRGSAPPRETPPSHPSIGDALPIKQPPMHRVHNEDSAERTSTDDAAVTCAEISTTKKLPAEAWPVASGPPERAEFNQGFAADAHVPSAT
jgi:hypothetical protein